jgi:carbonic anhydrase
MLRFACLATMIAALGCGGGEKQGEDSHADQARHWDYGKENGPAHWGELSPEFVLCAEGKRQSPIDLHDATPIDPMAFERDYQPGTLEVIHQEHVVDIVNNGHTVQVNYDKGSTFTHGEDVFELKQFHFHAPSEHTIDGKHYPLEMHLVHQSDSGELAVIGVLVEEGPEHQGFIGIFRYVPLERGEAVHYENVAVDIDALLPEIESTYRYYGSLTTPPCSEGVRWFVFTDPVQASALQIASMSELITPNNRPVQPRNDRDLGLAP